MSMAHRLDTAPTHVDVDHGEAGTRVAVAGHPIHAMLIPFPIALAFATLGSDFMYWWTGDAFFARAALWASGGAFWMGMLAALSGIVEVLAVPGIRRRGAAWSHGVAAVMLLSVVGANWGLRLRDAEAAVLPWGAFLSLMALGLVALAGWLGGKLVFEHQIGIVTDDGD
jgi:uncharacterized membrane protein